MKIVNHSGLRTSRIKNASKPVILKMHKNVPPAIGGRASSKHGKVRVVCKVRASVIATDLDVRMFIHNLNEQY